MDKKEDYSILLVDDDPTIVRILRHILADFTPLRFATSGRDALKLARESVPDLVLLDVEMPQCNGFEVCKAFKADQRLADVPILFVTTHESIDMETRSLEAGGVGVITKPPHAALVLARVRSQQRAKRALTDTLRNAVSVDFMTGTASRLHFDQVFNQEWKQMQAAGSALSLLLVQIDGIDTPRDDDDADRAATAMRRVADALHKIVTRPADLLGRYDLSTFSVLLPETNAEGATAVARRLLDALGVRGLSLSIGMGSLTGSAEGGAAPKPPTRRDVIDAAERALVDARSRGGSAAVLIRVTR